MGMKKADVCCSGSVGKGLREDKELRVCVAAAVTVVQVVIIARTKRDSVRCKGSDGGGDRGIEGGRIVCVQQS